MKQKSRTLLLICFLVFIAFDVTAQETVIANDLNVYSKVDKFPILITKEREFKLKQILDFIKLNLKYPENGIDCTGITIISFIVEKDGSISNKKFVKKLCPGFDENAMFVVDLMKQWKPGIKNNKLVRTQVTLPFRY